uniref:C2H2-type domain-containing protein n=1 Tax=Panagrellus redivivus TaxID=6233 RepID=A0A7E4URV0_PANRE
MAEETEGKQLASGLTLRRKKQIDYSEAAVAANAVKDVRQSPVRGARKRKQKPTEPDWKNRPRLVTQEEEKMDTAALVASTSTAAPAVSSPKASFKVILPKNRPNHLEYPSLASELDDFEGPKVSFTEAGITSFDIQLTGLPCSLCSHRTSTLGELERHLSLHPENFESCSLCASSDQFSMEGFSEHLLSHFIREPPYLVCLFCNVKLSKVHSDAVQHLLYYCPALPSCLLCGDDIENNDSVKHRQTVHNKLMHRFCCVSCLKGFASLTNFANHNCMIAYRCVCDLSVAYTDREDFEVHLNAAVLSDDKIHSLLVPDTRNHVRRVYFINVASIAGETIERKEWRNYGFLGVGREKVKLGPGFEKLKDQYLGLESQVSPYRRPMPQARPIRVPPPQPPQFVLTRPRVRVPVVPQRVAPANWNPNPGAIRILRPKAPLNLPRPTGGITINPGASIRVVAPRVYLNNKDSPLLHCNHCDAQFRRVFDLAEHVERLHNKDMSLSDKVPIGAMLNVCRPCRIVFESPTQYRAHMKQHEVMGQYFLNCGCCSFVGNTIGSIRHHQTTAKFWGCLPCRVRFTDERSFFYHVVLKKHAKIFFFCKTCNLGCTDVGLVVTHQRTCSGTDIGMIILNTLRYRPLDKVYYESITPKMALGYNRTNCCRPNCTLFATSSVYVLESCCCCLHNTPINAPYLKDMEWPNGEEFLKPVVSLPMFAKAAASDVILQPTFDHISVPSQYRQPPDFPSLPRPASVRFLKPRATAPSDAPRFVGPRHSAVRLSIPSSSSDDMSPQRRICLAVNAQIDATADAIRQKTAPGTDRNANRSDSPEVVNID